MKHYLKYFAISLLQISAGLTDEHKIQNLQKKADELCSMSKVWLNKLWFVIHDEVLNFHHWILCYYEPFHHNVKNQGKCHLIHIFKITIMWNVCPANMLVIIIYGHFKPWTILILLFCLVLILSVLFTVKLWVIWKILFWYFLKTSICLYHSI